MSFQDAIREIRLSTAGIHYLDTPRKELEKLAAKNESVTAPNNVLATGFLIREDLILTNRHVVESILNDQRSKGSFDYWAIDFTHPDESGRSCQSLKFVDFALGLFDPSPQERLDVGIIGITPGDLGPCHPVTFGDLDEIFVGNDVAISGYLLGKELLFAPGINRYGPVVHKGMISAVSPYDTTDKRNITSFLTDMKTGRRFSGSPVFVQETGHVIGLHYSGVKDTMGAEIPVDRQRVNSWIEYLDSAKSRGQKNVTDTIMLEGGGDIVRIDSDTA